MHLNDKDCRLWIVVGDARNTGDAAKIAVEVPIDRGEPHFDDPQSRRHASAALSKPDSHG
jgi:hypothetical protein